MLSKQGGKMKRNEVAIMLWSIVLGALLMSSMLVLSEPKWIENARKAKVECEENIPRKEICVAVFLPRSKD
jgi:hypothetical protein